MLRLAMSPQQSPAGSSTTSITYLTALTPKTKKRALSRLRLSHAPVRATREHTSQDSLYSSRVCTRCDKGVVDDEQHWLFDCDALGGIRQNHASTIERYPSLPELMAAVYDRSPAMAVLGMFLKLPSLSVAIGKALGPSSRPCNNNNYAAARYTKSFSTDNLNTVTSPWNDVDRFRVCWQGPSRC